MVGPKFPLARYALAAFGLFFLYASLRPFRGWRVPAESLFAFLWRPAVLQVEHPDVVLNVLGYVPLGCLLVLVLVRWLHESTAWLVAIAIAISTSFTIEVLQNFLPMRYPSSVDIVTNFIGASIGATFAIVVLPLLPAVRAPGRAHRTIHGLARDLGLPLVGMWWFALLAPTTALFSWGDWRRFFVLRSGLVATIETQFAYELLSAALSVLVLAVVVRVFTIDRRLAFWLTLLAVAVGLAVRTMAFGLYAGGAHALAWASHGVIAGVALGVIGSLLVARLRHGSVAVTGAVLVVMLLLAANLVPAVPVEVGAWYRMPWIDLARVAQLAASVWPLLVVGFVGFARSSREV